MSYIDDGGSAFPFGQVSEITGQPINGYFAPGMTLRDYFAAKAMSAVIANRLEEARTSGNTYKNPTLSEIIAEDCYIVADAMLKARGNK
jgi:hypothetical protein